MVEPHPANVPGDFYVEDGCCMMCEAPFAEAPTLFGRCQDSRGFQHCYVKQQPETQAELHQMLSAIHCSEMECIRYRGTDRLIQLRLVDAGDGPLCDDLATDLQRQSKLVVARLRRKSAWRSSLLGRFLRWCNGNRA